MARQIISASRRTDIPAFYAEWFMNRLRSGLVAVPNPMNPRQMSWVSLKPEDVEVIVFWTKDARPLVPHLEDIDRRGYRYYFQYTVTGYPPLLEPRTPPWRETVATIRELADRLGAERLVWRYDPILFTPELDERYHLESVERLAAALEGASQTLVISFVDFYRKARTNLRRASSGSLGPVSDRPLHMTPQEFAAAIVETVRSHGFSVQSCAEELDLIGAGVGRGRCIDPALIERLFGSHVRTKKDPGQRETCGCAVSKDIGMYDSCLHGCVYCYANLSERLAVENRRRMHHPQSACLLGWVEAPKEVFPPTRKSDQGGKGGPGGGEQPGRGSAISEAQLTLDDELKMSHS